VVITRYNNRTYRIDGIAWDMNPDMTFEGRNGEKIAYEKYYKDKYELQLRDKKQPLLMALPKDKDKRGGVTGPVFLIPEFCYMTGLSDAQRGNFGLMKDVGDITRPGPDTRVRSLQNFLQEDSERAGVQV
jgi:aubergine